MCKVDKRRKQMKRVDRYTKGDTLEMTQGRRRNLPGLLGLSLLAHDFVACNFW
jgi:hypothetical protein